MYTIEGENIVEIEINKSTFISYIKHVTTTDEAKEYIAKIKSMNSNATHNVTAYTVGKTGEFGHCSDDGEPSGTAGLPVLDVFRKNNITNFVCVVTRYFGGIKLGAGGLIRAYSKSASENLHQMKIVPIIEYKLIKFTFHYPYLNEIELILKEYNIIERSFSEKVSLKVMIASDLVENVINMIISKTNNMVHIERL